MSFICWQTLEKSNMHAYQVWQGAFQAQGSITETFGQPLLKKSNSSPDRLLRSWKVWSVSKFRERNQGTSDPFRTVPETLPKLVNTEVQINQRWNSLECWLRTLSRTRTATISLAQVFGIWFARPNEIIGREQITDPSHSWNSDTYSNRDKRKLCHCEFLLGAQPSWNRWEGSLQARHSNRGARWKQIQRSHHNTKQRQLRKPQVLWAKNISYIGWSWLRSWKVWAWTKFHERNHGSSDHFSSA